jgi:two-component SAPR family response regulator
MKRPFRFIIIDDDIVNNTLCNVIIRRTMDNAETQTFNSPEKGFDYLMKEYSSGEKTTVLFLDINMPVWTGWVFLENFDKLDDELKRHIKIYILSSSADPLDKDRAKVCKNIVDFVVKPLTKKKLLSIMSGYL